MQQQDPHRITSLSGYMGIIERLELGAESTDMPAKPVLLFRGQSDSSYELLPAIARGGTDDYNDSLLNYEDDIIAAAKQRLPNLFNDLLSPVDTLALLQHYGIPTRLLDVTENPLVALYFACGGSNDCNGEVIVFCAFDLDVKNYPIVEAIADSHNLLPEGAENSLSDFYDMMVDQPYFRYQRRVLSRMIRNDADKERWICDCCRRLIHVRASVNSQRQIAQSGRFILFPNEISAGDAGAISNRHFENRIKPIDKDGSDVFARFAIPASSKEKLLAGLRKVAISEGSLFPDDYDKVCKDVYERVSGDSNAYRRMHM